MNNASLIRSRVWNNLAAVAWPDSRYDKDFAEFIPDFFGSDEATDRIMALPCAKTGRYVFITPDNCLVELRRRLLVAGCTLVVSTYGIHRGFFLLEPGMVPPGQELFAAWLDGLEHFGRCISLQEISARGKFDYLVTGASAVSRDGVRFGKGHGYFDIEWGMFTELGLIAEQVSVIAMVHDVQVVEDRLIPSETDVVVDMIATPSALHVVNRVLPRPRGIRWDMLDDAVIAATPPLAELRRMRSPLA